MQYISTRGDGTQYSYDEILLKGLSEDGGLFVPLNWPKFSNDQLLKMQDLDYAALASKIISKFTSDVFNEDEVFKVCQKVYKSFNHKDVAPLKKINENNYLMELFHGPTLAFKDYAMQFLSMDFERVLKSKNQKALILGATSGDTGSAALNAFAGHSEIDIFILFPKGRVSYVQEAQMTSVNADGAHSIQIEGNFDDCQEIVKEIFLDQKFRQRVNLSAINSINWARLLPQIVYYFFAALKLGAPDKKVVFSVPTGNFGNIFAGFCAYKMGLPIDKLICASNRNNILSRYFKSRKMERQSIEPSLSPSMDIQVSSNFERLLFEICDRDSSLVRLKMKKFKEEGIFKVDQKSFNKYEDLFVANYLSDQNIIEEILRIYKLSKIIIDPHTACGTFSANQARISNQVDDNIPIISLACAHPSKFPEAVNKAIGIKPELPDAIRDLLKKDKKSLFAPADSNTIKSLIEGYRRD